MMIANRALVLVLVGTLCAAAAWGQSKDSDPIRFSVGLSGEVTDNRDSAPDAVKEDNLDLNVEPRLELSHVGEHTDMSFSYGAAYRDRSDPSPIQNETEWHHDLDLRLVHRVSPRLTVQFDERLDYTDDPSIEAFGTALRRDSSYGMNRVSLSADAQIDERHALVLQGHHMVKRYDDDIAADESDEDKIVAKTGVRRQMSPTIGVELAVTWTDFASENSLGLDRGLQSTVASLGLDKQLGDSAQAALRVGWQTVEYALDELQSDDSVYANIRLTGQPTAMAHLTAEAEYGIRNSYAFPFVSQEHTHVFLEVLLEASQSIVFGLSGEYRIEDYSEETLPMSVAAARAAGGLATSGEETTLLARARVTCKLGGNLSVTLAQLFEDVESDVFTTFTRNATRLSVNKRF